MLLLHIQGKHTRHISISIQPQGTHREQPVDEEERADVRLSQQAPRLEVHRVIPQLYDDSRARSVLFIDHGRFLCLRSRRLDFDSRAVRGLSGDALLNFGHLGGDSADQHCLGRSFRLLLVPFFSWAQQRLGRGGCVESRYPAKGFGHHQTLWFSYYS